MSMPDFIHDAGASVVSNNILSGAGKLKWLVREEPLNPMDNGWQFFSDIDDDAYLSDPDNFSITTFNRVAEIEPAVLGIYALPPGSDLELRRVAGRLRFYDNNTGLPLTLG